MKAAASADYSALAFMANYVYPSELANRLSSCGSIIHLNSRSLRKHFDEITGLLASIRHHFAVICLSETWLTPSDGNLFAFHGYNSEYCYREDSGHGGASIFVASSLSYRRRSDLSLDVLKCESVWIEFPETCFSQDAKKLVIGCIYRSPSSSLTDFCEALNKVLHTLSFERKNVVIMGDMNVNLLDTTTPSYMEYTNILNGYGFECLITVPTRRSINGLSTLIDHALSNLIPVPSSGVI